MESNPYTPKLDRGAPAYTKLQCLAAHAPTLPSGLRKSILDAEKSDKALHAVEKILFQDRTFRALVGTTQAIDVIFGGVKANALPESAWAIVDHRIATERSVFIFDFDIVI